MYSMDDLRLSVNETGQRTAIEGVRTRVYTAGTI